MLPPMSPFANFLKTSFLAILLILALSLQSASQSAKVLKGSPPRPTLLPGFDFAHCVVGPGRLRICKAISETGFLIKVEKAGKQVASWPVQVYVGETSDFEVLETDFDGDGRRELVVANHDATSNGFAVAFWTIYIFPDSRFHGPQAPLIFRVEDYHAFGTFVPERSSIPILTTRWLWSQDPQGRRGGGLYLVGQWWRYRSGELVPVLEKPLLARRYLNSFAAELGRTRSDQRAPYLWLKRRRVELLKETPLTGSGEEEVRHGVVQRVSATPFAKSETAVEIVFKPDDGRPLTLQYLGDSDHQGESSLNYLGDAASGRIYPAGYFPASREKWLRGRRARLVTYRKGAQFERLRVLWLKPNTEAGK